MNLGAGWLRPRKDREGAAILKNGKPVMNISISIDLPFFGHINCTLVRVAEKKNEKAPDFDLVWYPERDKPKVDEHGSNYEPEPEGW